MSRSQSFRSIGLAMALIASLALGACDKKGVPPPPTPKAMAGVVAATPASDPSLPSAAAAVAESSSNPASR